MSTAKAGVVVRPVRFTDDVAAMRSFLEALGLAPRVESDRGGWVDMVAGAGMVAVHEAATSDTGGVPGQTRLSFEADDHDLLADRLGRYGFSEVAVHDENYGRVLVVTDPVGDDLLVDERSEDLYGYRLHELDRADRALSVLPVRFTEQPSPYAASLAAFGLTGEADGDGALFAAGGGDHGYVGVQPEPVDGPALIAGPGACRLDFRAAADLAQVADRLRVAGHGELTLTTTGSGTVLDVTDPDGQLVRVHQAPVHG